MPGPNGPIGCLVSYNERQASLMSGDKAPFHLDGGPLLWSGLFLPHWQTLDVAHRLGVPLRFMPYMDGPGTPFYEMSPIGSVNHTAMALSLDLRPDSPTFGSPHHCVDYDIMLSRADGKDINFKQVESLVAFFDLKLGIVNAYGHIARGMPCPTPPNASTGKGGDDDEEADPEEQEEYARALQSYEYQLARWTKASQITKAQAEESAARATPKNFVAFFEEYRAKKAIEDKEWDKVECPVDLGLPKCKTCAQQGTGKMPMQACSGCKLVHYCGSDCQKQDWAEHKSMCKAISKALKAQKSKGSK